MKKVAKTKQKQKQSQNVKQTVIIRLDKEGKRKAVKRRKRMPKKEQEGASSMQRSLPATVAYQSSYSIPYPVFKEAPKVATVAPEPQATPFLQDTGQVGTEGRVTILDKPTKKEQLGDLLVPVDREKDLSNQFLENEQMLKAAKNFWQKKQEEFNKPAPPEKPLPAQFEKKFVLPQISNMEYTGPPLPSTESNPAKADDKDIPPQFASSFMQPQIQAGLPLGQENLPSKKGPGPIAAKLPKETLTVSSASMAEEQNIPDSVMKKESKPREGSWAYLLLQFKQITGQEVSQYKAKQQFKTKEAFAKHVDELNRQK